MDQKKIPFSVFKDLSEAFDTLNYGMLLSKLQCYGLRGATLNWFEITFLTVLNKAKYLLKIQTLRTSRISFILAGLMALAHRLPD